MMTWISMRRVHGIEPFKSTFKSVAISSHYGCARSSRRRGAAIRRLVLSLTRARPARMMVSLDIASYRARYPARDSRANNVGVHRKVFEISRQLTRAARGHI